MNCLAIIVDYESEADALRLALELARTPEADEGRLHVIVVDNGNEKPRAPSNLPACVRTLRTPENLGYGGALAAAVESAQFKSDTYWFLNPDLEIETDCLTRLLESLENHPDTGAVGPVVYWGKTSRIWGARGVIDPSRGLTAMTPWENEDALPHWSYIPGCSLLIRADEYNAVGGIPTRYKLYYEETELCARIQKRGRALRVVPTARAYHHVHSLKGGIPGRAFSYFFIRNNLAFWNLNFERSLLRQSARLVLVALREVIAPLRRTRSPWVFVSRLGLVAAGYLDGFVFALHGRTLFEHFLFPDMTQS